VVHSDDSTGPRDGDDTATMAGPVESMGRRTQHNSDRMNTAVLAVIGLFLLILLSVRIGISRDTEIQRRE
jgi:hypothetical protein